MSTRYNTTTSGEVRHMCVIMNIREHLHEYNVEHKLTLRVHFE